MDCGGFFRIQRLELHARSPTRRATSSILLKKSGQQSQGRTRTTLLVPLLDDIFERLSDYEAKYCIFQKLI
jgi:hypothetical protein